MLETIKARFLAHMERHPGIEWAEVARRLAENPAALEAVKGMEASGGEPDVIGFSEDGEGLLFCDCSAETPVGRRSLCYDDAALKKRAKNPPAGSAVEQARAMGVQLMTETLYRRLQALGAFDAKTSSWIATPEDIRDRGGALFCERRYGRVFTFHNGAESYYSVRGWRGYVRI